MRQCRQCRRIMSIECFQKYSKKDKYYTYCKECAKINLEITTKYKAGDDDYKRLLNLIKLVPNAEFPPSIKKLMGIREEDLLLKYLSNYANGLKEWLDKDISNYTRKQLNDIYDMLENQYAPVIEVLPSGKKVREEKYLDMLDKLWDKFEDECVK